MSVWIWECRFGIGFEFEDLGLNVGWGLVSNLPNPKDKVSTRKIHLLGILHSKKKISEFGTKFQSSFGFGPKS
jgi:hypothetical protein